MHTSSQRCHRFPSFGFLSRSVRNGCLEPCRCGYIHDVPDVWSGNVEEHFRDGKDPLSESEGYEANVHD